MEISSLPSSPLPERFAHAFSACCHVLRKSMRAPRTRRIICTPCAISLGLLLADQALAVPFSIQSDGTFDGSWTFPSGGALPTAVGATKPYTATATAGATADGLTGPAFGKVITGTKLTYTSAGLASGLPSGTFTSGTVTAPDKVTAPSGSSSDGKITITGNHTGPDANSATIGGGATVKAAAKKGSTASFFATARDPFPFQMQDLSPIPDGTLLNFSLTLPASSNSLPAAGATNDWNVTYKVWIKDIDTSDVTTFYMADPALLYSLSLSSGPSGFSVDFEPGAPAGFPVTFSQSTSQIDAAMLAALQGGWTGDLSVVNGMIDVGGHVSATLGTEGDIDMEDVGTSAPVPEPANILLIAVGLAGIGLGKCKASKRA